MPEWPSRGSTRRLARASRGVRRSHRVSRREGAPLVSGSRSPGPASDPSRRRREPARYVHDGTRVLDSECTLCQTCVTSCPEGNLGLSLGLDVGTTRLPPPPPPPEVRARV